MDQIYDKYIKIFKPKKIYLSKKYQIYVKGEIYHNSKKINDLIIKSYEKNQIERLANKFNGNYIIFFSDLSKNVFFIINSQLSYLNIFYRTNKKNFNVSNNINNLLKFEKSSNKYKYFEWLVLGGRALTNETFLNNIFYLLPGETLSIDKNKNIKIYEKEYLSYDTGHKKVSSKSLVKSLKTAVALRTKDVKSNILLGLSGGLDSRILSGIADKKKIITYTYGNLTNFEKIFAQYVSLKSGFKKHEEINIKDDEYFPKDIFNDFIKIGNLNSTFQHNYQNKLFNNISKKYASNKIMLGCALDQFLGSSFSDKNLYKISNLNQFYSWFKKKYFLFSESELKNIFPNEYPILLKKLKMNLFHIISKFKYKNFVDLNDALHFEIRILRWYNRNLNFINNNDKIIISPTYDKYFLNNCFRTNFKNRIKDVYRKEMLKLINNKLYEIPSLSGFLPPSINEVTKKSYKKIISQLENLNKKTDNINKIPSFLYDVNLSKVILNSKDYIFFRSVVLKKIKFSKKQNSKIKSLNRKILFSTKNNSIKKIKKIIFLLSFYNIKIFLNEKNKRK